MVNYYTKGSQDKLKKTILGMGNSNLLNIPLDIFIESIMLCWGMSTKSANRWVKNFEATHLIEVRCLDHDKDIWVANFLDGEKRVI
jgi:hypothetical protein